MFEITRTIQSYSERSEEFLKQNDFLTCSWRFLSSNTLEQLRLKLKKKQLLNIENLQENLGKVFAAIICYNDELSSSLNSPAVYK